jgi:hypothetical protein
MIGLHTEAQSLGTVVLISQNTAAVNLILAWATGPILFHNTVLYFLAQDHG